MIPLYPISELIADKLLDRISDAQNGVVALFRTYAPTVEVDPYYFNIDFSPTSTNFVRGQIDPAQLELTGIVKYPFTCLYTLETGQDNRQKFTIFSGIIRAIFDVYLSWNQIRGLQNFEKYLNCVEAAMISVANATVNQDWGKPITYNGNIMCRRGPLSFQGENWRQKMGFSLMFRIDTGP